MRTPTKFATGLMGLGLLAVSYKLGLPPVTAVANTAQPVQTPSAPEPTTAPSLAPSTPTNPTQNKPITNTSGSTVTKPKPTSKPAATTKPAPVDPAPVDPPATSTSVTKTGSSVGYRFGTVQVSVTKDASGSITDIGLVRAGATGGRQAAFTSLVSMAIAAQGSSFGNISQATYTTDAFKTALDSALANF